MDPFSVLLTLTLIILAQNAVRIVGKTQINQFIWDLYLKYSNDQQILKLRNLKAESYDVYKQRSNTSAQDKYAKWTKLNRKYDQLQAEIKTVSDQVSLQQQAIDKYLGLAITVTTTLPLWLFRFKYRKQPLFYFPKDTFPSYLEWILSFPSVPKGSIGIMFWVLLLNKFVSNLEFIVKTFSTKVEEPVPIVKVEDLSPN
ncbi:BA75_04947T0 [Komagataella pastoris]|uniref:Golgi to ER traffic protein 1 n=1 Tax=Komagataella pastoris TaxID=4922 RepID=A0A1B2JIJ1_PICPA|nr:BA75_04947T0 [Komagataella pastoris]